MNRHILLSTLVAGVMCATAQDLHTTITVDRTVQPDIRDASRPGGTVPELLQPDIKIKQLSQAEYTGAGTLSQQISVLPAAAWRDSVDMPRYRGYASVGYLPLYNLGANVGYRFIDTPRAGLGLWAQYNGESYNGDIPYFDDALFTNHAGTIGGNASLRFGQNSLLTAKGSINVKSIRVPYFVNESDNEFRRSYTQGVKDLRAQAGWQSRHGDLVYNLQGALGYFGMDNDIPAIIRHHKESVRQAYVDFGFGFGFTDPGSKVPWVGLDADFNGMRSTNIPEMGKGFQLFYNYYNMWLGTLRPYLRFDNDVLQGMVGVKLSTGHRFGAKTRIAPEAQIAYRPASPFVMYAHVTGGQYINRMRDIVDVNPYVLPTESYGVSNIPMAVTGGINVGPYDGMSLSLSGGYAIAKDLLSPCIAILRSGHIESSYEYVDTKSWYFGGEVSYAYKQLFVLSGGVKCAGADREYNSWYQWGDGAKVVADVSLKVTPVDGVEAHLTYDMRYDRKERAVIYPYNSILQVIYVGTPNLGTINSVNLGGSYKLNDQITAFLEAYNLLNTRYKLVSGMPGPGIHGLLGVACKF